MFVSLRLRTDRLTGLFIVFYAPIFVQSKTKTAEKFKTAIPVGS